MGPLQASPIIRTRRIRRWSVPFVSSASPRGKFVASRATAATVCLSKRSKKPSPRTAPTARDRFASSPMRERRILAPWILCQKLSKLCRREDLWLHADGAYGAVAVLSPTYRIRLEGLGGVDSLSLDPHKWLFQPYEIGCVLLRDGELLTKHLEAHPEYLQDVKAGEGEVNFSDLGFQLTRQFRALKLWMTIQLFGLDHIRAAIERWASRSGEGGDVRAWPRRARGGLGGRARSRQLSLPRQVER